MRKIVIIFIIGIALSGCAIIKKSGTGTQRLVFSGNVLENTMSQNISNRSYFIQKAEVEVIRPEGRDKFIATIKFEKPDRYLISLKSRTGIEGARIFITKDTILVNDRINKKLYSGTTAYLKLKYGMPQNLLPLIFGDIILDKKSESSNIECHDDKAALDCAVKGIYLSYIIDCKKNKTEMVSIGEQEISLKFNKYFILNNIMIPGTVGFRAGKYNTAVNIKISKVEYPWDGNVNFIPGKGYELIELR